MKWRGSYLLNSLENRRPRRESIPYICDFSRGGLNARFMRSHLNLAPRPQIWLMKFTGFVCSSLNELNRNKKGVKF